MASISHRFLANSSMRNSVLANYSFSINNISFAQSCSNLRALMILRITVFSKIFIAAENNCTLVNPRTTVSICMCTYLSSPKVQSGPQDASISYRCAFALESFSKSLFNKKKDFFKIFAFLLPYSNKKKMICSGSIKPVVP